jgi:2-hydroxychromene-2-carboxylate isomerase
VDRCARRTPRPHRELARNAAGRELPGHRHQEPGLRGYFARGVDLSDAAALRALCAEFDLDPVQAEAAWSDPAVKAGLKAANDAAIAAGVFGAPYFLIDGEPFWGNDRRPQIERWLATGPF